jgi:ankyrin repeat protein
MHAHSHTAAEAQESLAQLHSTVEQILESNHAISVQNHTLSAQNHAISVQLRELIAQRSLNDDVEPDTTENLPTETIHAAHPPHPGPESLPTSPSVTASSAGSRRTSIFDNEDAASFMTAATSFSMRSIRSSFRDALENSRVYKRVRRRGRDSESILTLESSERGCSWSMLSDLSLGELSIADIWVIELPICLSDLWDPEPFRVDSTSITTVSAPRRSSSRLNWSTKGRIHNAIAAGNDYVVRTLLTMGSDIEELNRNGETPLALALLKKRDVIAKLLLEKGASIDLAAAKAAQGGNEAVIRMLLTRGVSVEARDNQGRTLLTLAVLENREPIVKLLLESGADVGACDNQGRTPLILAILENREPIVKLLLESGADVGACDNQGRTPLILATLENREPIFKLLVENAAHVEAPDTMALLAYAVFKEQTAIVKLLLESCADAEVKAMCDSLGKEDAIIRFLLEKGASIPILKAIGSTTSLEGRLESAILRGEENVVRLLLFMGADVEERGRHNMTPLLYAAWYSSLTIAKILVEAGADMKARDIVGRTVLHRAARGGDVELVQFLFDNGALELLDATDKDGDTPLHDGAISNHLPVAQMLVERGARVNAQNKSGQTPYHIARRRCTEVAKYLWSRLSPDEQAQETPPA